MFGVLTGPLCTSTGESFGGGGESLSYNDALPILKNEKNETH
jgi:hypothetical protein